MKELAVVVLITGWTFISSGNGTNMSTELRTKYNMEEIMEIPLPRELMIEKIKYLTPKERKKLLATLSKKLICHRI